MTAKYVRPRLTLAKGAKRLQDMDVHGELAHEPRSYRGRLEWVPVTPDGHPLEQVLPQHIQLQMGPTTADPPGGPHEGARAQTTYAPTFVYTPPDGSGRLVVDGVSGAILDADLLANRRQSAVRFAVLFGLTAFMAFSAAEVFEESYRVGLLLSAGQSTAYPWVLLLLAVVAMAVFNFRFAQVLAQPWSAAARPFLTGRISATGSMAAAVTFDALSVVCVAIAITSVVPALEQYLNGSTRALLAPLVRIPAALLCAWLAKQAANSQRERLELRGSGARHVDAIAMIDGLVLILRSLVITFLLIELASKSGLIVYIANTIGVAAPTHTFVEETALAIAGAIALLRSHIPIEKRLPFALGMIAGELARVVLGDVGEAGAKLAVTLVAALALSARTGWLDGIRNAVSANLGAALGRIIGRVAGVVLVGSTGLYLGEVFGEEIFALLLVGLKTTVRERTDHVEFVHDPRTRGDLLAAAVAIGLSLVLYSATPMARAGAGLRTMQGESLSDLITTPNVDDPVRGRVVVTHLLQYGKNNEAYAIDRNLDARFEKRGAVVERDKGDWMKRLLQRGGTTALGRCNPACVERVSKSLTADPLPADQREDYFVLVVIAPGEVWVWAIDLRTGQYYEHEKYAPPGLAQKTAEALLDGIDGQLW